jgi:hypothetical protein
MNMQNMHEDQKAILERLKKEFINDRHAGAHSMINGPIYNCLVGFCAQDLEFARLMLSTDKTLGDCFKHVSSHIKSGCSDFEVYTRAVQFYIPGVKIRMWMEIDMIGESEGVAFSRDGDLTVDVYGKRDLPTEEKKAKAEKTPAKAEKKPENAGKTAKVLDMPKQQTSDETEDAAPKKRKMISFDFLGI